MDYIDKVVVDGDGKMVVKWYVRDSLPEDSTKYYITDVQTEAALGNMFNPLAATAF